MQMKSYKEIEEMLSNYPIIKAEIANLKIDLESLREEAFKGDVNISMLGSKNYAEVVPGRCTAHDVHSKVEAMVVGDIRGIDKEIFEVLDKIKERERTVLKIDNIVETLKERQRKLVELRYFKGYTVGEVARYLDVTESTVTRSRRKVLDRFKSIA